MEDWKHLHSQSKVVDLHSHPGLKMSLFGRDFASSKLRPLSNVFTSSFWPMSVRTNFDKLDPGGVDAQLATVYIPEEQWFDDFPILKALRFVTPRVRKFLKQSYYDATIANMNLLEAQVSRFNAKRVSEPHELRPRRLRVVKSPSALQSAIDDNEVALIHSVEGAHSLQGDCWDKVLKPDLVPSTVMQSEIFMNLDDLAKRGVAYLTLAHFYPNCCVSSPCFPYPGYSFTFIKKAGLFDKWDHTKGLSKLGEEVVEKMIDLGMIVDITHLTPVARKRVYEIVDTTFARQDHAVIASHVGAHSINPDPYCLHDWELKWLADHECVAGVIFMNYWLSPVDTPLGIKYLIETIKHMAKVGSWRVVSLGTDFDGFTDPPDEIKDMSELPRLTRELASLHFDALNKSRLFTDQQIKDMLGGNALRVLTNGWTGVK